MSLNVTKVPMPNGTLEILYERIPLLSDLLDDGTYLAGGALRTLFSLTETLSPEDTDIDLFFSNNRRMETCKKYVEASGLYDKAFECPEGSLTTYVAKEGGWKVQFIAFMHYNSVPELLLSFDFSVTMVGTDGRELWKADTFFSDVTEKRLRWNVITYPSSSLRRMMKYARKGYWMDETEYNRFVEMVWNHDDNISDTHLVYID